MPSFYAPNAHGQVPLQQSDYGMRYGHGVYDNHQEPLVFATYQPTVAGELSLLHPDPYDMYKSAAVRSSSMYHQPNRYINAGASNVQQQIGAPMMRPPPVDERYNQDGRDKRQSTHRSHRNQPQNAKEEKPVGGVSAKLDYEVELMTDFLSEMTVGIIQPGISIPVNFRKWVLQLLNSTRLPSGSILLGLSYLSLRVRGLSAQGRFAPTERSLYLMTTVALILGSKFLDDNTFQNKSWAEVSQISVAELFKEEREWLIAFGHRLHHDPRSADGYKCWEEKWNRYKSRVSASSSVLHSLDTNVHRQRQPRQHLSAVEYHPYPKPAMSTFGTENTAPESHYRTPTYSPYDNWYNQRSAAERSPSTAPHTGPTTPDYYQGAWGPVDNYAARHAAYSYPTVPQFAPQLPSQQAPYYQPHYGHNVQSAWNCHGATCQCHSCRQAQMFQPRYGPIVVG